MRLIIALIILLTAHTAFASVTLPWETSFDCADWPNNDSTLVCDGMANGVDGTKSIYATYNRPGSAGKGLQTYMGAGQNNGAPGTKITFSPRSEIHIRWYMKYDTSISYTTLEDDKIIFTYPNSVRIIFYGWNSFRLESPGTSVGFLKSSGYGWDTVMSSGALDDNGHRHGDGEWHLFEVYYKLSTGLDGRVKLWVDETLVLDTTERTAESATTLDTIQFGANQKYARAGGNVYFDDLKVTTTEDYIGPTDGTSYTTCYPDIDGDLYPGAGSEYVETCSNNYYTSSHFTSLTTDCDDTDPAYNPAASQVCGNGINEQTCEAIDDSCTAEPTCSDGIQNQDETGVDCGGSCDDCETSGDTTRYMPVFSGFSIPPSLGGTVPVLVR